jgi:alcohol dehydrogenase YqhD (iron-dependent ADH family)
MNNFEFYSPTHIIFGRDVISRLGPECRRFGRKALFLYGQRSIKDSGLYSHICKQLSDAGIDYIEHKGVSANPVLSHAEAGIRKAKEAGVDFVLAVGGGSVIDESKGIAAGACSDIKLWDFYEKKSVVQAALPIVAVQTLPATSSETNQAGVLTNEETKEKFSIRSHDLVPKVAFLDPELTFTIPAQYTAYACFDIMSHMLEGYFTMNDTFSPVHEGFAEGLVRAVMDSIPRLIADPADYDARASVMWAGALAWNGITNAGLEGASIPNHMIEHPLSAIYNVPHGAGLCVIMPAWLEYKKEAHVSRIIKFGERILGIQGLSEKNSQLEAADVVIEEFRRWITSINCPLTMKQIGIPDPDIEQLTVHAMKLADLWGVKGYDASSIADIYRLCL